MLFKNLTFLKFLNYVGWFLTFLCREWARSLEFIYRRDFGTDYLKPITLLSSSGALLLTAFMGGFYEISAIEQASLLCFAGLILLLGLIHVGQATTNAQQQQQSYDPEDVGTSLVLLGLFRLEQKLHSQYGIQPTSGIQTFLNKIGDREAKLFIEPGLSIFIGFVFATLNLLALGSVFIFGGITIAVKTLILGHQQHQAYNRFVKGKAKAHRTTTIRQHGVAQARNLRTQQIKNRLGQSSPGQAAKPQAKPPQKTYRKNP